MILWISLGLFIISLSYYAIDAKLQPNREGKECVRIRACPTKRTCGIHNPQKA